MNTDYTLKINSVDISSYIKPYSYSTDWIPVAGDKVTTMDGVDHVSVLRWKGGVHFALKPMSASDLSTIVAAFGGGAIEVQYSNLQKNEVLTEYMKPTRQSAAMVLKNASHTFIGDMSLDLEAM